MAYTTLIDPQAVQDHLDNPLWVIFDCRHQLGDPEFGRRAYADSHLPGARFADMDGTLAGPPGQGTGRHPLPDMEAFAEWLGAQGVGKDSQVVAYDDANGAMAARLWWMLRYLGHDAVAVLDGGLARWQAEGRPLDDRRPGWTPRRFTPQPREAERITLAELQRRYREPGLALVDARAPERYEGREEPIDPVAGHIPGARNLPYAANVDDEGAFLPAERLRARFAHLAGNPGGEVVHYCGSGVSACHNMLAMAAAGLPTGRLFVGSWSQWCADPDRPVATGPEGDSGDSGQ